MQAFDDDNLSYKMNVPERKQNGNGKKCTSFSINVEMSRTT